MALVAAVAVAVFLSAPLSAKASASDELVGGWQFVEVAADVGVSFEHQLPVGAPVTEPLMMHGGAAAGDLDGDGLQDLVAVRGPDLGNALYRQLPDGSFEEIGR